MADTPIERAAAAVVVLPSSAAAPVAQHPRRGRLPKGVISLKDAWLRRGVDQLHAAEALRAKHDRITAVRVWHVDQATDPVGQLCALAIAITADGMIRTDSCGIEPEMLPALIGELRCVTATLVQAAAERAPDDWATPGGNVVVLKQA